MKEPADGFRSDLKSVQRFVVDEHGKFVRLHDELDARQARSLSRYVAEHHNCPAMNSLALDPSHKKVNEGNQGSETRRSRRWRGRSRRGRSRRAFRGLANPRRLQKGSRRGRSESLLGWFGRMPVEIESLGGRIRREVRKVSSASTHPMITHRLQKDFRKSRAFHLLIRHFDQPIVFSLTSLPPSTTSPTSSRSRTTLQRPSHLDLTPLPPPHLAHSHAARAIARSPSIAASSMWVRIHARAFSATSSPYCS